MSTATATRRTRRTVATIPTQTVTTTLGAASYGRISSDPGHDRKGVDRQDAKNRVRIDAEPGWHYVDSYIDDNLSASKKNVRRREFERLLEDVRRGLIQVIVVYMSGRLLRNARDRLRVRELFTEHGVKVICTDGQDHDYSTPAGRMVAGIMGEVDQHETEQLAERIKESKRQAAEEGRSTGSRCYGYQADPLAPKNAKIRLIVPEEAEVIREARDRILKGESLRSIVLDFDGRGLTTWRGAQWSTSTLREVMTNPTIAGRRVYLGEDIRKADWEPIISYEDHLKIVELLTGRKKATHPASAQVVHLLSGIATCGRCALGQCECTGNVDGKGHRVTVVGHGESVYKGRVFPRHYRCQDHPVGCRSLRRSADFVDDYVEETVLTMLAEPGVRESLVISGAPDADAMLEVQRQIDSCESRARALGAEMAQVDPTDAVGRMAYRASLEKLRNEMDGLQRRRAQMSRSSVISGIVDLDHIVGHWRDGGLTLAQKRTIISMAVEITILPSGRGKKAGTAHIRVVRRVPA